MLQLLHPIFIRNLSINLFIYIYIICLLFVYIIKGNNSKSTKSDDNDDNCTTNNDNEPIHKPQLHKPTQTNFRWKSIWQKNSFPRLIPAFGLVGKALR